MTTSSSIQRLAFATIALASVTACSGDATAPASGRSLSVSFIAGSSAAAPTRGVFSPAMDVSLAVSGHVLSVSSVQLVLSKLELRQASTSCPDAEDRGDHDGCRELSVDPMVIDLPLATPTSAVNVPVPSGSYSALEAKIAASNALDATHPGLAGSSIRVEGAYDGTPFTYTSPIRSRLEFTFDPPLTVESSGINLTVNVDVASWFRDARGGIIDPATAKAGQPNASTVAKNITRSFHAFRDDDHDGHDDHGGRGSEGHDDQSSGSGNGGHGTDG